jgi:hypothetical protein
MVVETVPGVDRNPGPVLGHTIGFDIQGQLDRILQGRARMSGNQIGDQELFFAQLGIDLFIPLLESLVDTGPGLPIARRVPSLMCSGATFN